MNIQMKLYWLLKSQYIIVLTLLLSFSNISYAGATQDTLDAVAKTILFTAWPTAKYVSSSYDKTSIKDNGNIEVIFKINAESYWTNKPIWLEAIAVVDQNGHFKDLKYGNYHAVFPPGTAAKVALSILNESGKNSSNENSNSQSVISYNSHSIDLQSDNNIELTKFVRSYVDAIKTNDLDKRIEFYASLVDFYSKDNANKSFIRDDIYNHQIKPYPTRDFELRSEPTITWDTPKKVTVSFTIDYLLTKDSGKQITSNRIIEMDLIRKDEGWLIQAEHSKGKDAV